MPEMVARLSGLVPVMRGKHIAANPNYASELKRRIVERSTDVNGCWLWGLRHQRNGYGAIRAFGRVMPAHRASFLAFKGAVPDGLEVGHSCHTKSCVNPDHLHAITHAENMRQMFDLRHRSKTK